MPTEFILPDGSAVNLAALHAYRDRHAAEGARLEAVRAEFASEQADGVDAASAARHLAAVAHLGREPETSEEYAEALEWVDRQGVTISAVEQDDEDERSVLDERLAIASSIHNVAAAKVPPNATEQDWVDAYRESEPGVRSWLADWSAA